MEPGRKKIIHTLVGHRYANAIAMNSDGSKIISGCGRKVCVWNAITGTHSYSVSIDTHCVAISKMGNIFMIGRNTETKNTIVYNAQTGEEKYNLFSNDMCDVTFVAINSDERKALSAGVKKNSWYSENEILVWDLITGTALYSLKGLSNILKNIAINNNFTTIVACSIDVKDNILVWRLYDADIIHALKSSLTIAQIKLLYHWYYMMLQGIKPVMRCNSYTYLVYKTLPRFIKQLKLKKYIKLLA